LFDQEGKGDKALEAINNYFVELERMIESISLPQLEAVLRLLEEAYRNGHRIFIMGNGGSAATSSHFALDLAKNTILPGAPRVKAISLNTAMKLTGHFILNCIGS
jgi:D-sedoheptulose 7-phosphate isomerase